MEKLLKKMVIPLLILIWSGTYYLEVAGKSAKAARLIGPVFYVMCLFFVIIVFTDYMEWKKENKSAKAANPKPATGKTTVMGAATVVYLIVMPYIGFIISTFIFLAGSFIYLNAKNKALSAGLAAVLVAAMWIGFKVLLKVPLPVSFLGI